MNENYLMLDGKRIDLTEEQIKTLGLDKKDYFHGDKSNGFFIKPNGEIAAISNVIDADEKWINQLYETANLCTNKELLEQRALHEILNRLLWRFSMQNDGDKIDWDDIESCKYKIYRNHEDWTHEVDNNNYLCSVGEIYFYSKEIAQQAIEEVIRPFLKAHPGFKW